VATRVDGMVGEGKASPIESAGAAPGVLALHGFGGTPLEVELVVDVARELGLAARAPLLPGHGTQVSELARSRFVDWQSAAEAAFDEFSAGHGPLIVAGLSMGSLVAARLAARRPEKTIALVMLANALWLTAPFPAWALSAVAALKIRDFSVPKLGADIADPAARRTHLTYPAQPVHAAIEVLRAGALVRADLSRVRCPALIAHGARDRVCPVSNAQRAFDLLGSADKRVVVLPRSRHIITRDLERALLRRELSSFFSALPALQRRDASRFREPSALE
jgi:carboxylesterase